MLLKARLTAGARPPRCRAVRLAEIIDPPALAAPVSRDPDDDAVLALAVAAQPDLIISGDDDLLVLGAHAGIPIVSPRRALAIVGG